MGILTHIHDSPMTSPPYPHHIPYKSSIFHRISKLPGSLAQDVWGWTIAACGSGVVLSAVGTPFENLLAWHVAERSKAQPRGCWDRTLFFVGGVYMCTIYMCIIYIYMYVYIITCSVYIYIYHYIPIHVYCIHIILLLGYDLYLCLFISYKHVLKGEQNERIGWPWSL